MLIDILQIQLKDAAILCFISLYTESIQGGTQNEAVAHCCAFWICEIFRKIACGATVVLLLLNHAQLNHMELMKQKNVIKILTISNSTLIGLLERTEPLDPPRTDFPFTGMTLKYSTYLTVVHNMICICHI